MKKMSLKTRWGTVCYFISDPWDKNRETIFFLHGMTADHTLFDRQYEHFGKDFNLITWDAPAHGQSRPFEKFTYETAAVCAKKILDLCGVSQAVFVGQSMGGFISQSVIKRFPEAVRAFVSIDSCPFGEGYYSPSDRWWLRQIEWMSGLFPERVLKAAIAYQVAVTKDARSDMLRMLRGYGKKELCHLMGVGFGGFLEDNCDLELKCPVLLVVGEKDRTGKVISYNRAWSRRTGFHLVTVMGAAHNSNADKPHEVNNVISEFINTL